MKYSFGYFNTFCGPLPISILQIIGFQAPDSYFAIIAQRLIKNVLQSQYVDPSKFPRSERSERL